MATQASNRTGRQGWRLPGWLVVPEIAVVVMALPVMALLAMGMIATGAAAADGAPGWQGPAGWQAPAARQEPAERQESSKRQEPAEREKLDEWQEPAAIVSRHGTLIATLTVTEQPVVLGPVTIPGLVYNGTYAGPVLRVHPGDRLLVRLVNQLGEPTNLHFHGIQTSPAGNSDNIHVVVGPNESFLYSVKIPDSQPPGLYWYHAHVHGISERQVMSGLSGALVVEGFAQQFPELAGVTERLFVLKEFEFPDTEDAVIDGDLHERLQTINGQAGVLLPMRPHETQLWRLANQSANRIFHLVAPGLRFRIIAEDGVPRTSERAVEVLDIEPGSRLEVLADAGEPGAFELLSKGVLTGKARDRILGHVVVAGEPAGPVGPMVRFPALEDMRGKAIDVRRTITFSQDSKAQRYFMDGKLFDHDRVDIRVPLGSTEEWTIRNESDDFHEFHIHQLNFQVVAVDGAPVAFAGYRDVVRVPERGSVTIRMAFTRREMLGRFVFHCHVLKHEDRGMMAVIEVYDPAASARAPASTSAITRFIRSLIRTTADLPYDFCGL